MKVLLCLVLAFGCAAAIGVVRRDDVVVFDEGEHPDPKPEVPEPEVPEDSSTSTTTTTTTTPTTSTTTTTTTTEEPESGIPVRFKLQRYLNPSNLLADGGNCDLFGWSKCDPFFEVLFSKKHNGKMFNFTTSVTNNVDEILPGIDLGIQFGRNPISFLSEPGTEIHFQVSAFDDDVIGKPELIGRYVFTFVVGSPRVEETKQHGSARMTVIVY